MIHADITSRILLQHLIFIKTSDSFRNRTMRLSRNKRSKLKKVYRKDRLRYSVGKNIYNSPQDNDTTVAEEHCAVYVSTCYLSCQLNAASLIRITCENIVISIKRDLLKSLPSKKISILQSQKLVPGK